MKTCDARWTHRGKLSLVKYVKSTRLAITRYLSGEPIPALEGLRLTKSKWPHWMRHWVKLDLTNPMVIKYLFTLLTAFRGFRFSPILDTTPIISEFKGSLPMMSEREILMISRWLGISKAECSFKTFHMSTKSGPNGQAILSALTDIQSLPPDLICDIFTVGGSSLESIMTDIMKPVYQELNLAQVFNAVFDLRGSKYRKLSYFSDKEGKTRVIGILDYWSQTALIPLHNEINRVLRNIEQDGTFNQNSFLPVLRNCKGPYYSFDLSNATDRMPVDLQCKLIDLIIGSKRSQAWKRILTAWPYPHKDVPGDGVYYRCGQPMGAYSSWPAMALTHHFLVKLAGLRAGYPDFKQYALLGDDIVIAHSTVARKYKELLQHLDMPISESKTHVSQHMFEFAKRWVYHGVEVTGFSISGLIEVWGKYPLLHNFLETQANHGWELSFDRHPELVRRIWRIYDKPSQCERFIKLYSVFNALTEVKKTKQFLSSPYKVMSVYFGLPELEDAKATALVEQCIKQVRVQMLNSDLEIYQSGLDKYLRDIGQTYDRLFPGLDTPSYREFSRNRLPIIVAANNRIDQSMEVMMAMWNPDVTVDELYCLDGLAKWSISPRIFSMRNSHLHQVHIARMVKSFINEVKSELNKLPVPGP